MALREADVRRSEADHVATEVTGSALPDRAVGIV
jgi:hypothetical protein